MSFDSIAAAVLDTLLAAVPGSTGERRLRLTEALSSAQFPHAFVHSPARPVREVLDWGQRREELELLLSWATRAADQTAAMAEWDALTTALEADPTLGGQVDNLSIDTDEMREHVDAGALRLIAGSVRLERTVTVGATALPAPAPDASLRGQVLAALDAAILARTSAVSVLPDPLARLRPITAGTTSAARLALVTGYRPTSNQQWRQLGLVITLAHRLAEPGHPELERDYLNTTLLDDLEALADPDLYRELVVPLAPGGRGVLSVTEAPTVATTERVGHVLETPVAVQFFIAEEP